MKCKNCGREFEIDHYGQKYCSLECYEDKSYRNIKNYKKRLIEEPNTKIEERKKKRTKGITIARA